MGRAQLRGDHARTNLVSSRSGMISKKNFSCLQEACVCYILSNKNIHTLLAFPNKCVGSLRKAVLYDASVARSP